MKLSERVQSDTPKFFKKVRNIGIMLAAISGTIISAPVALPVVLIKIASYLGVASVVASSVSQMTMLVEPDAAEKEKAKEDGGEFTN